MQHIDAADGHDVVAVNLVAMLVDEDAPVGIAIEGDAEIGTMFDDSLRNHLRAGRPAAGVDVRAIRLDPIGKNLGAQFFQNRRGNPVGGSVGAIEDDFQA